LALGVASWFDSPVDATLAFFGGRRMKTANEGLASTEAATLPRPPAASRLGEILARNKLIDREQLRLALERQKRAASGGLGEHLIALGYITEDVLAAQLGEHFGIPVVDPSEREIPEEILSLVPSSLIRKHLILPLELNERTLTVSMADPTNLPALNEVKFLTGYEVRTTVTSTRSMLRAIDRLLGGKGHLENR
jgi:type IV pilus assembly protein PilB